MLGGLRWPCSLDFGLVLIIAGLLGGSIGCECAERNGPHDSPLFIPYSLTCVPDLLCASAGGKDQREGCWATQED
jgi:hypothetical protein